MRRRPRDQSVTIKNMEYNIDKAWEMGCEAAAAKGALGQGGRGRRLGAGGPAAADELNKKYGHMVTVFAGARPWRAAHLRHPEHEARQGDGVAHSPRTTHHAPHHSPLHRTPLLQVARRISLMEQEGITFCSGVEKARTRAISSRASTRPSPRLDRPE